MKSEESWIKARFLARDGDPAPVKWPPPGPFWCTGYSGDDMIPVIVGYFKSEAQFKEYWPDAIDVDVETVQEIKFTERFPKPQWWSIGV